jgi:hypothetical protein
VAVQRDERVLHDLLGLRPVTEQNHGEANQAGTMGPEQDVERLLRVRAYSDSALAQFGWLGHDDLPSDIVHAYKSPPKRKG